MSYFSDLALEAEKFLSNKNLDILENYYTKVGKRKKKSVKNF